MMWSIFDNNWRIFWGLFFKWGTAHDTFPFPRKCSHCFLFRFFLFPCNYTVRIPYVCTSFERYLSHLSTKSVFAKIPIFSRYITSSSKIFFLLILFESSCYMYLIIFCLNFRYNSVSCLINSLMVSLLLLPHFALRILSLNVLLRSLFFCFCITRFLLHLYI